MTATKRQMSAAGLRGIVDDFRQRAFPHWRLIGNDRLVRESGPVVQQIGFERLRTGEYRPTGCIRVLVAPENAGLHRFLNVRDRSVFPEQHRDKFDDVVRAIRREFVPCVDEPLDAETSLAIYASEMPLQSGDAVAIAALAAYLSKWEIAAEWCEKLIEMIGDGDIPGWQRTQKQFADSLAKWIESGTAVTELSRIMDQERQRLGLD